MEAIGQGLVLEKKRLFGSKVVVAERVNTYSPALFGGGSFIVLHSMQVAVVSHDQLGRNSRFWRESNRIRRKVGASGVLVEE